MVTGRKPRTPACLILLMFIAAACVLLPRATAAQSLTGALIGTVTDQQGAVVVGALVQLSSPALIGPPVTQKTDVRGQLRFLALPPGVYVLDVTFPGFTTFHQENIPIGASATIELPVRLTVAGLAEALVVEVSRLDARDPGFTTRIGLTDLNGIPTRRASMFDPIRAAPGVSATSASSGTVTTVSAFGSGTNENQFLFDGTNFTCPCNGVARSEPGIDFLQEIQIQSVGASAEFGNVQGAVINVITKQGSARFLYDGSYYSQSASLTSQPVRLLDTSTQTQTGYERVRNRDFTTSLGGPAVRDRLWFFAGYQYLRDYDSQPGANPKRPRTYEQNKVFVKLTWRLTPSWQLVQSFHEEFWVNPEQPTRVLPFEATRRRNATVPAMTFGHLTHTASSNTVWEVRAGRFVYTERNPPSTGDLTTASRTNRTTGVTTGAPQTFGGTTIIRTTTKAMLNHYRPGLAGADHHVKAGVQIERGEHHVTTVIPTGRRYVDDLTNSNFPQAVSRAPAHDGAMFINPAVFVTDALTFGDRLTINAGVRFDHQRAISQDLHAVDPEGRETNEIIKGRGTLYTWNIVSPRLGVTMKLSADGRTMLRASYGRFSQGVLTGELSPFHPGVTPTTTTGFDAATGEYTRPISVVDPKRNLDLDRKTRAPRTDEYSIGVDREIGPRLAVAVAYVHKDGANFIGWTDIGGVYQASTRTLPGDLTVPVSVLTNGTGARLFRLTNQRDYTLTYNGLVLAAEKRRSSGWHASGSYTFSRAYGLQPSTGTAASPQVGSVAGAAPLTFGQDPNTLTNARGRLANDRPHMLRLSGSVDIPKTGVVLAGNLQHITGKPWAAFAQVNLVQGDQRIQLEPRGARRLSSQTLLDVRLSRALSVGRSGRIELLLDVLNVLNETAEEGLATEVLTSETQRNANFGQPSVFVDPRRAMISVRLNLGGR